MKPERTLIAQRPLARHCPELLRPAPAASELLPLIAQFGERLARKLAAGIARMSGETPAVSGNPPRECTMTELAGEVAPLAANSLLATEARDAPFLASIEAAAVLRMVDRAFGGRGHVPSPLPEAFPLSAELLIARLESVVTAAADEAFAPPLAGPVQALRRDGSLQRLAPFPAETPLVALTLDVREASAAASWALTLAFPLATLAEIFGGDIPQAGKPRAHAGRNASDEPFGDMPLPVTAVLVDMRLGFSALSALKPGDILPVAVARSVPLKIGDKTIAHGTIGEVDDRVAVQITHAF
jgi:flagellar motor switch protein FliM